MGVQQSGCRLLRSPVRACHTGERVSGTPGSMERRVHQSSSAAAQQDSAASDTAATPSRSLSRRYPQRGPPQLIRGSSQQIAVSQPAMYPPSALERVGRDVRVLILQCLTSRHKLTAVARLNHCFRPLPALAFLRDTIDALLPGAVQACYAERTATGQLSMLSLWAMQAEQPGRSTLFTCPRSLSSLPHMSALARVDITVDLPDCTEATASLRYILRSVLLLPSLTTLEIDADRPGCYQPMPEQDWTDDALPSPVSLRHLALRHVSLSAASFRRLCFLPLESLTMHDCTVLPGKDTPAAEAEQPSASVLQQLAYVGSPSRALVSAIGSYALQLRELVLTVCIVVQRPSPAWDFSPLMTEAGAARLPHLTKLYLPTPWNVRSNSWLPELKQACSAASQQLVAAYCAQLTSLQVDVLSEASVSSWLRLLFCRCDHLDDLCVMSWTMEWRQPVELHFEPAEPGEVLTLPRLRTLKLANLPLTDGGLLSLLRRCPELEKCKLVNLRHVTPAGMGAALRCCPKLNGECAS